MQPRLQATLADFVPALRFVPPDRVEEHLGHPGLPPAWWAGVAVVRAVEVFGAAELPDRLSGLAYAELSHLRLGDLLPAAWLARNDFRLSQWPDGVRTNVLVRTPDWADLLTATVREISEWTQIGTSTVRPVVATLFAEVLGLLPGDDEDDDEPSPSVPFTLTKAPAARPAPADDAGAADGLPPGTLPGAVADDADAGAVSDAALAELGYLGDPDAELRPVPLPEPPTGDLAAVVRWLAEEAPDVPLMSELVRVTLETVAVVGVDDAPDEVRASLDRLMRLVPGSLHPVGLAPRDGSGEDGDHGDGRADEDGYGAAYDDGYDEGCNDGYDDGYDDPYTAELPAVRRPADDASPDVPGAPDDHHDAGDAPDPAGEGFDAFGEVPPPTRDDMPAAAGGADAVSAGESAVAGEAPGDAPGDDTPGLDAFGEVPGMTRDDVPAVRLTGEPGSGASAGAEDADATPPAAARPAVPAADQGTAQLSVRRGGPGTIPPRPSAPPPGVLPPVPAPPDPSTLPSEGRAGAVPADPEGTVVMASGQSPAVSDATVMIGRAAPGGRAAGAREPHAGTPAAGNLAMVMASWFSGRDPRWRSIARDRLFTDSPREIASLAAEFDADATEVEALEAELAAYLDEQAARDGESRVAGHLRWVRGRVDGLTTVTELRDLHEKHSATVPGLGLPVWQVVRGLLRLHTSADGWLSAEPTGELAARTAEVLSSACARGPVPLAAVRDRLSALGIRPSLQQAWITRLDEFRVENGQVLSANADTLERPAAPPVPAAPALPSPEDSARCFADEQGTWWYRLDVTEDFLAGARVPLPAGFVSPLGLDAGGQLRLHHPLGPAALRWEDDGPYAVSLAAVLTGMGAADGDMVFLASVRPGRLEARLLPGDRAVRLPRWARALRRTGVDPVPDQVNLPAMLGERIGLGSGCDLKTVLKRLQERGDADVLELLGVVPSRG